MEPQSVNVPQPPAKIDNSLPVMQQGEHIIFNLRRHPIGIIVTYTLTALLLIATAVLCFVVPKSLSGDGSGRAVQLGELAFLVVAILAIIFALISTIVYWGNRWILTTDSVTQVTQKSLFNRESSQLSLGNVEDVSAEKKGILTYIFNYGALKVETAGETGKFVFYYCPNPNYYAQQLLEAREAFDQTSEQERDGSRPISNPQRTENDSIPG
jgi:uncharacterized membrane protein YdbT with pleckstrin-like domain